MAENEKCPNCGAAIKLAYEGSAVQTYKCGTIEAMRGGNPEDIVWKVSDDCRAAGPFPLTAAKEAHDQIAQLRAKLAAAEAIVTAVQDDSLAERIVRDCHDDCHDDRHCSTCKARSAGIEAYREAVMVAAGVSRCELR